MSTNQNPNNDNKVDADFWTCLDSFLIKERDAIFSILTHVRLAIAAGAIIAIICCARSFTGPFMAYLELHQGREAGSSPQTVITLMIVVTISSLSILTVVLFALFHLHRRFRLALLETLKKTVDSVESPLKEANIEIPEKTARLLQSLKYD